MINRKGAHSHKIPDNDFEQLYRLQVRELEEFALFPMDPDGRIRTWNRGIEKTFGYSEEEWIGRHASIIYNEDDRDAGVAETEMRTAAEQGRSLDVRWHQRKDGSRVYMTGVLRSLRDDAGHVIGYSKVFVDDTARKQLEDALTRSNADLRQFAYIASHDLQEPLRTVSGFAELLTARYGNVLPEEATKMLDFINEGVKRMSKLTSDLLEYSQLAQETARVTSVHMDEDLETAISLLHGSIQDAGAVITHDPLPDIELDRSQMVRLFQNLLGNAIKFRSRERTPRIHISAERQGEEWLIRVTDNVLGFPPEQSRVIFEPFVRLHHADEYPGSGIGLAACKRIVESYGGRIGAESQPDQGSTFWFTVPATKSDQAMMGSRR